MNSNNIGLGFHLLNPIEEEVILAFNEYDEYFFPEYHERRSGHPTLKIISKLIKQGLIIRGTPFKLTRSGKQVRQELLEKYASI